MATQVEALQAEPCELEAAVRSGDITRATEMARKLAEKKANISLRVGELPLNLPERPISVKIFIEDRYTSGVYVTWELPPSATFIALKCMVYKKFEFPIQLQRWIVRKRLVGDNEMLGPCCLNGAEPMYLYLVPARSAGITRELAHAKYLEVSRQLTSQILPQSPQGGHHAGTMVPQDQSNGTLNPEKRHPVGLTQTDMAVLPNVNELSLIRESANDVTDNILPVGWLCPDCTCMNQPTRPGCEICCADRPDDYTIPDDYVPTEAERTRMERELQIEAQAAEDLEVQRRVNLQKILSIHELPLVRSTSSFSCPICFDDIPPGGGVILRDCLHIFCIDCLRGHVEASSAAIISCPFNDGNYICTSQLLEHEIRALVTPEVYERLQVMSIQEAESREANSFHCCTADCHGWCIYEDDVNTFDCPVCNHSNCLTCKAQHEGATCRQYQDSLRARATNDVAAQRTQKKIEKMLKKGDAMNCPTCKIVVMKKDGCDWIRCTMCKTEICWVTKGPRWGPAGEGDDSGGCRCGVNDKLCHPNCQNCH
jgi:RanBP-type and C3HC4-type zinc finger-containing protein 1